MQYDHDFRRLRVSKALGGPAPRCHHNQCGHLIDEWAPSGTFTDYIYLDGEPLAKAVGSTLRFIHTDHLATPRLMTNSIRGVAWQITMRPFGDSPTITGSDTLNLRFPGQYYDSETGLHQNWWREYRPDIGRYTQPDPLAQVQFDGANPIRLDGGSYYAYVGNDPVGSTDPLGLCRTCGIKKGPEYNVSGTVQGMTTLEFHAEFLNDTSHDPACCEVRQLIAWQQGPPPDWFKPPFDKRNTWYEDRSESGKRFRRRGPSALPTQELPNYYHGNEFDGTDRPWVNNPDIYSFRLAVVDLCRGGITIYTSKTIQVRMGGL